MIYDNVASLCKTACISIARLEAETGIGNGTIGRWKKSSPNVDTVKKIADFFGVSVDRLIAGSEPPTN